MAAHQGDVVAVEEDLVELRHALTLGGDLTATEGARAISVRVVICDAPRAHGSRARRAWPAGGGGALFGHVVQDHVHVVVEPSQGADQLFVATHHDPYSRADAFVDQLCAPGRRAVRVRRRGAGARAAARGTPSGSTALAIEGEAAVC